MSSMPTVSLVEQADAILRAATQLQKTLNDQGLQQPSLAVGGRKDWHDAARSPEALKARSLLIDASQTMLNLALGPTDAMLALTGCEVSKLEVMRTLDALGVPEAVPLRADISTEELASTLAVNEPLLHRQLQFAISQGMFYEPREGFIAHTNLSSVLIDFSPYIKIRFSPMFMKGVYKIPEALKGSKTDSGCLVPCQLADSRHRDMWQILEEDYPEGQGMKLFSKSMELTLLSYMGPSFGPYGDGFDWESLGAGTVIDVGGGKGHVEVSLAKKFPSLNFVIQDLPANAEPAQALITQHKAQDRIQFTAHDFLHPQPTQAAPPKAYMLSRVLHDWQDDDCVRILRNLLPAMESHGTRLFIAERVLPHRTGEIPNHVESQLRTRDILMYTLYGGGERTMGGWLALFKKADARLTVDSVKRPLLSGHSFLTLSIGADR